MNILIAGGTGGGRRDEAGLGRERACGMLGPDAITPVEVRGVIESTVGGKGLKLDGGIVLRRRWSLQWFWWNLGQSFRDTRGFVCGRGRRHLLAEVPCRRLRRQCLEQMETRI